MRLGGIETSLLDWPGQVSAVVFFAGCNFRCSYCHNASLIPRDSGRRYTVKEVNDILTERSITVDSIVFCGGEPTLQSYYVLECLDIASKLGLRSKLDTNGSESHAVQKILRKGVDKVSLDIKTVPDHERYLMVIGGCSTIAIPIVETIRSMKLVKKYNTELEVRTTIVPSLNDTPEDMLEIIRYIEPYADEYTIQRYDNTNVYHPILRRIEPPTMEDLEILAEIAREHIPKVNISAKTL